MRRETSRIRLGTTKDVWIYITPDPNQKGGTAARVERAVRYLWSRGVYPSPTAVIMRLHGKLRRSANLNGVETLVRNRMLKELGIGRQKMTGHHDPEYLQPRSQADLIRKLESKLRAAQSEIDALRQERKNACT